MEGEKPDAKQETRIEGIRRMWQPDAEWLEMVSQQTYEMLRDQYMPDLPPAGYGEHLVGILFDVGPSATTGLGPTPITYQELAAWQALSGIELQPWEARWLRRLSAEWIGEQQKACKHFAPAPWQPDEVK